MAYVYILYSEKIDKHYIGSCLDLESRIVEHNQHAYPGSFTTQSDDWVLYFSLSTESEKTARDIEKHIKRMKSRKYLLDLKRYPAIAEKLLINYSI